MSKVGDLQKNKSIEKESHPNLKANYTDGYMSGHIKYDFSKILAEKTSENGL